MTRSFTEINSAIAWQLTQSIGEDRFEMWFSAPNAISVKEGSVVISAVDDFSLAYIRKQFEGVIRDCIAAVVGTDSKVQYAVKETASSESAQQNLFSDSELQAARQDGDVDRVKVAAGEKNRRSKKEDASRRRRQRNAESTGPQLSFLNKNGRQVSESGKPRSSSQLSLDDFQFGTDNRLMEVAISELLRDPNKFNPLYLHGDSGCGKSHLLHGIVGAARKSANYRRCLSITSEQFTTNFVEALQSKQLTGFRARFRNLDLLAVDDLHFLAGKQATIIEFQNTLETLLRQGKQVVLTSDRPLQDLHGSCDQLITRISCGLACPIAYPNVDGRLAIVRRLAGERQVQLDDAVVRLVAERIGRDVRQLSGAVNRLKAAALTMSGPIDVEMATELLGDLFHWQAPILSLSRIEKVVCDLCGVETDELRGKKRIKRVSIARMLAMWLSRKHTSAGLAEIGKYYGNRSHSTVSAAEKKINELLTAKSDVDLKSQTSSVASAIERLQNQLRVG